MEIQRIDTLHLFPKLEDQFITLLNSLNEEDWKSQTVAKLWKVKDVVAHLLDGNIRILSMLRDGHFSESPSTNTYIGLVDFLNGLNADWVKAFHRVSPQMLIMLHQTTWRPYYDYYSSLDPEGKATFPVSWAGESESKNWMHIAREYTEKFLHQQQIRDAVGKEGLLNETFFQPFASICLLALPFTLADDESPVGSTLEWEITGGIDARWFLKKDANGWTFEGMHLSTPSTRISIKADSFWKLVSKSKRYNDLSNEILIEGDKDLAFKALSMVSFMA